MKGLRTFWRHLRDAFRNMTRNGLGTGTTFLMMILTLLTVGGLILFMVNVENVASNIESGVQIRVHIDLGASPEDELNLKSEIEALDNVEAVTYITREEELENVIATYGEEFELFQGDSNPLYNVYEVSVTDLNLLEETSEAIRDLDFVMDVNYGEGSTQNLVSILQTGRYIIAALAAVMVVVSVIRVTQSIRLTIDARHVDIEIMELVGATRTYIEAPFLIEGGLIGTLSGLISSVLLYFFYRGLKTAAMSMTGINLIVNIPVFPIMVIIGIGLIIFGLIIGVIGAYRAVKNYLQVY